MAISDKIKELADIKANIKKSLKYLGKVPGDDMTQFADMIEPIEVSPEESFFKDYFVPGPETMTSDGDKFYIQTTEKCVFDYDDEHLILKEIKESDVPPVLGFETKSAKIPIREINRAIIDNYDNLWGHESYDKLTQYAVKPYVFDTEGIVINSDFYAPQDNLCTAILYYDYNGSKIGNKSITFHYLPNLQKITGFKFTGNSLEYAFNQLQNNVNLGEIKVDCTGVTNYRYMFVKSSFSDIPKLENALPVNMEGTFLSSGLTNDMLYKVAENIDFSKVEKFNNVFAGTKLDRPDLSFLNSTTALTNVDEMLSGIDVTGVDFSFLKGNPKLKNPKFFKGCKGTADLSIMAELNYDSFNALFDSVDFPVDLNCLSGFAVSDFYAMFRLCNISEIDLSPLDTSNLTSCYSMFNYAKTERIHLGRFNITKVPNAPYGGMASMFTGTTKLTTVTGEFIGKIKQSNFDLGSAPLTAESVMIFFNALDEEYPSTITISKTTNGYLSEEQLAIPTSKGWTVAVS